MFRSDRLLSLDRLLSCFLLSLLFVSVFLISGCEEDKAAKVRSDEVSIERGVASGSAEVIEVSASSRGDSIPSDAIKVTPETDANPPTSSSSDFKDPVPIASMINSAGAEDSPFMTSDGKSLYFFFTPDVRVPAEKQLFDGVTGIYVSDRVGDSWSVPRRVMLQKEGKLALDGCEFVQDNIIWFCSAREGYTGINWFSAGLEDGVWKDFRLSDFDPDYKVGELHFTKDWSAVYFHSDRAGGKGSLDIWMSKSVDGVWQSPVNIEAVNSAGSEGWPALSPDETELWFSKDYGVWRSILVDGEWGAPERMFSPLTGEPTIDPVGNVYFVHHFFKDDKMIEADIYFAEKKR
jgi:hypothetical protein